VFQAAGPANEDARSPNLKVAHITDCLLNVGHDEMATRMLQ